jgi:segregation and condensation protein A
MQQQILSFLMKDEDVSWRQMLHEVVEQEGMNPWDIDVTQLTQSYIKTVKEMKKHDLRISGKILLAAAILLKLKSAHFMNSDIANLDRLLNQTEEYIGEDFLEEFGCMVPHKIKEKQEFQLIHRNPQPRNRKVSIHDLVEALQRAMASKKKILAKQRPIKFTLPDRKIDIMEAINDIYHKISYYAQKDNIKKLPFTRLLPPNARKQEKAFTFIPILHLENQLKLETEQEKPFDEIYVKLSTKAKAK